MARHLRERPRIWRVEQNNGQYVGVIAASNKDAAIERACKKFGIDPAQRTLLKVREIGRNAVGK